MPDIIISDIAMLLGKAIVAIFLSLLLNYIYIAWISRLKKPSDKEMLERLYVSWQGGLSREKLYYYGMQSLSGDLLTLPQPQKELKDKKRGKAGRNRKLSRAERKKRNR